MSARRFRRDREREARRERRRRRRLRGFAAGGAALGATAFAAPAAQAVDYTVSTNADSGAGSLRDAIDDANANPGTDNVLFASNVTGQITLTTGSLYISDPVNIQGPGAGTLAVSGNYDDRVIDIYMQGSLRSGTPRGAAGDPVTISGLTITEGFLSGPAEGAGILNRNSDLTVVESEITGNIIVGDSAPEGAGAGIASPGELTLQRSTVSDNHVEYGGNGIRAIGEGNYGGSGGGVFLGASSATISNSTISGNSAAGGGGVLSNQGDDDDLTISNSTIAANAALGGGGVYRKYDEGTGVTNILSTIIGGNTAVFFADDVEGSGTGAPPRDPFNLAFSLIENPENQTFNQTGPNILGQDPMLDALGPHGGPTDTHLPAETSPVIDKGTAFGSTLDQTLGARTADFPPVPNAVGGDGTDIGSLERELLEPGPGPIVGQEGPRRRCLGQVATIVGTTKKDVIVGTPNRDVIRGYRGNDVIKGVDGDDVICGDGGNDKIRTGPGDDDVRGGNAGDRIRGGTGDDTLRGGSGIDRIFGEEDNDKMFGGAKVGPRSGPARGGSPGNVCNGGSGADEAIGCETVSGVP